MDAQLKNIILAAVYFLLSVILTWAFIAVSPLYISEQQMILSTAVAGGKWALQIILAFIFLRNNAWTFIKNIGFVCFVGSCILIPYILMNILPEVKFDFFVPSLIVAVLVMIAMYFRAVKKSNVEPIWFYGWLLSLATAISLQLTVVFHVF